MTRVTINNINKALAAADLPYEIVKGDCYFWFAALDSVPLDAAEIPSVYSNHLRGMSVDEYVMHVKTS
jgi:hypothetical protein